jgi:thiamine pyrophosphate-dependent acetolactate synthase large subunit-like protein
VLRCPWHGWGFHPLSGVSPHPRRKSVAAYEVQEREDGVYVGVPQAVATRTVSDVMVQTMVNWGVRHVFGMVGHSNLGLAEAVRKQEAEGNLTFIGVRHEGAASFACSAYAKLCGQPAACLTIAGPGATNLLTGLWDAHVDRAPLLALTGQVNTQVLGPGAFQEIDQASAFQAVAAWSQTVLTTSRHAELMSLALKHALVSRGVAHLIFPDEVQVLPAADAEAFDPEGRLAEIGITPAAESLERALALLGRCRRPAVIVGYGARQAMAEVVALAERLRAPVLTTFKAKGQLPDDHPLAAGVLGRSGTPIASWFMDKADLLLVFGASFADHTGIDRTKPIIQVDFERLALGKSHPVAVPVWGEIGLTAEALRQQLPGDLAAVDIRDELAQQWAAWRKEKERRAGEDRGRGLNSATIFAALSRQAPADAVIAVDVGNNTYSFGRYFECQSHSILMSGYLGSIGFGFPAAIGAWAAAPHRPILSISGDGGFGQYLAEFTTAVKYGMNIAHVLLNNHELGKISKEQRAGQWPVWQTALNNPDFAEFAKLCGGYGVRVTDAGELDEAIASAIAYEGPALVEIISDAELT